MKRSGRRSDGWGRGALATVLIATALVTLGLLLAQAWRAVYARRAVAEGVLRERAEFAADRYAATLNTEFQSVFYDALTVFHGWAWGDPLPSLEEGNPSTPEPLPPGAIPFTFAISPRDELALSGPSDPREEGRWIRDHVAAHARTVYPRPAPYAVLTDELRGEPIVVVYRREGGPRTPERRVFGFGVDLRAFAPLYERLLAETRLLPVPRGRDQDQDPQSGLTLELATPRGFPIFRAGPASESAVFGSPVSAARAARLVVRIGLPPSGGPALAQVGAPRFEVASLVGLSLLTALLLGAALLELRRVAQLARLREEFVSNVSHELRTPLTQIRMFAETVLLGRAPSKEEERRALRVIEQEARRLSGLVENVLSFASLRDGGPGLRPEATDLEELVSSVVEGFRPLARARDATLQWTVRGCPRIEVDHEAFRRIVLNLLDNAVKYGPPGQTIRLAVTCEADRLEIRVDDEGPGVPPARRREIWERFSRAVEPGSAVAGAGIGLSVVHDLAQLHDGEVRVEDGPGGGARFRVVLALPSPPPAPDGS